MKTSKFKKFAYLVQLPLRNYEILRELVKNCEVLLYSFFYKSLDATVGIDGLHLICRSSAAAAHTDPNISKDSIHGDCLLILLDNRSNITL